LCRPYRTLGQRQTSTPGCALVLTHIWAGVQAGQGECETPSSRRDSLRGGRGPGVPLGPAGAGPSLHPRLRSTAPSGQARSPHPGQRPPRNPTVLVVVAPVAAVAAVLLLLLGLLFRPDGPGELSRGWSGGAETAKAVSAPAEPPVSTPYLTSPERAREPCVAPGVRTCGKMCVRIRTALRAWYVLPLQGPRSFEACHCRWPASTGCPGRITP